MPLGKNADAGDFIKDFEKSDAPQFKGKSKEKRRKMAVAAFLAQRKEQKEQAQQPEQENLQEEMMFKVSIENLPDMVVVGKSPGQVKSHLRKIVKQPSMILSVERMTKVQVKKRWRDMAMSGEPEQNIKDKGGD
jgi:preprotein translocase subunit Sec63